MDLDSSIENNDYYKTYISNPERNEDTANRYKRILKKLCKATGCTIDEIITTCIDEQTIVTTIPLEPDENGHLRHKEIKFNINNKDASINKYFKQYEEFCRKRNNKGITIQGETDSLRAFLSEFGVILPKRKKFEDDSKDWYLPTKEDFNFISQDLSLVHVALLNFLTSTGMRIKDACSLTIGDFMSATSEYHDFVDVEDFIDHADENMIGTWVFEPNKTIRHKTKCITFNSAYSSNLILQYLRHVKNEYLPYKNNKNKRENKKLKNNKKNTNIKINKKYPLFGSRKHEFKEPIPPKSVGGDWGRKSKKFQSWKIKQIEQKIKDGELSQDDYEEEVAKIPKFHPHICRKFFSTVVSNNCGDIRICALLEGHSDGLPNDKYYIKKTVKDIREIYINNIHDALSLDNVETRIVTNKETEELNKKVSEADKKIEALTNENKEKDKEIAELKQLISQTQEQMEQTTKAVEELKIRERPDIRNTINTYFHDNCRDDILQKEREKDGENHLGYKKCIVICEIAHEIALEKKSEFSADEEYLDKLIKKAIAKCSFNQDMIIPKYNEIHEKNIQLYEINTTMSKIVWDIIGIIGHHEDIWEMVKDNQKTLKTIIIKHIQNSNYDINNISFEDLNQIAEDVIMEYFDTI